MHRFFFRTMLYIKLLITAFLFCFTTFYGMAQINEPATNSVYSFLYRMAAKGIIEFKDVVLPIERKEITAYLNTIKQNSSKNTDLLTKVDKQELSFYLDDFFYDNDKYESSKESSINWLKKDFTQNRFRVFGTQSGNSSLFIDPVAGVEATKFTSLHNTSYFNGVRLYGYLGKRVGFNFFFRDVTEIGDSLDYYKQFGSTQGIVNTSNKGNQINFSNLNFNLGYAWKNGSISIGKDNLNWGYGQSGNIVLSSKTPSFLYLKLRYSPFKWLDFNYFHATLKSDILDSSRSYNTGVGVAGGFREVYRTKYLANHSFTVKAMKGLDISFGESIVYSDQFDFGYLIPINFFKAYDQYSSNYLLNGGSNGQIFAQISSRNQIKNTHLYAVLFIDEIRLSKIFDRKESRNQLGYTIGVNKTDLMLPNLTFGAEYTKVRGGVYNNIIPTQSYFNSSYALGDWMGQNGDRLFFYSTYSPVARLKMKVSYQLIRKGADFTLSEQYGTFSPAFLENKLFNSKEAMGSIIYEFTHSLKVSATIRNLSINYPKVTTSRNQTAFSFGISYGM